MCRGTITIMASLVGIPAELLVQICSDLRTGDILNLCRSCKSLYSAAHPLLFCHITIRWSTSAARNKATKFTSLLLFILRHPSYARYIRTVDVPWFDYNACRNSTLWSLKGDPSLSSPEDVALVRGVIEELCPTESGRHEWYQSVVKRVDRGAIVALILALCTHLEGFTANIDFVPPINSWFPDVIRRAVSAPDGRATRLSRFHKLTHFTLLNPSSFDHDLSMITFLLSFYLPSVTNLCFHDALLDPENEIELWDPTSYDFNIPAWPLAHPPLAASLTTLKFKHTSARPGAIEFLLRHTPNLQSLFYDCYVPPSCSPFNLTTLRKGLDHVRDTLAHLVLRFDIVDDEGRNLAAVIRGSLGPLGSMTALEHLDASPMLLFGRVKPQDAAPLADVLPPGLKRLIMNGDLWYYDTFNTWAEEHVGALLMAFFDGPCRTATPRLEEFVLDTERFNPIYPEDWSDREELRYWEDEENQEALQQLVESQGIRCWILTES